MPRLLATAFHRVDEGTSGVDERAGACAHCASDVLDTLVYLICTEASRSRPFHTLAQLGQAQAFQASKVWLSLLYLVDYFRAQRVHRHPTQDCTEGTL